MSTIEERLLALEREIEKLKQRNVTVVSLDEFSDDLGDIKAGRFIAGEGDLDEGTMTGTVMMYPGYELVIGEDTYHLTIVGFQDGIMQFGLSAEDGQALFAGGNAKIGIDGIAINKLGYLILHTATDGETERIGSQGMWAEPGGTTPCYGFGISSPASDELVTNGDAESGDLTGWTVSDTGWSNSESVPYEGDYSFRGYSAIGDTTTRTFTADSISVSEVTGYRFSYRFKHNSGASNTVTLRHYLKWYDSSDNLLRIDTVNHVPQTSGQLPWDLESENVISPANADYVVISFSLKLESYGNQAAEVFVDNITLKAMAVNAQLYFNSTGKLKLDGNDLVPDSALVGFTQMRGYLANGTEVAADVSDTVVDSNTRSGLRKHWGSGAFSAVGAYTKCYVLLAKGIYKFQLAYNKAVGFGKVDLYIDGVKQNSTSLDMYSSSSTYNSEWTLGSVEVLTDGVHEVKLVVIGKNSSSAGYGISGSIMSFVRTD